MMMKKVLMPLLLIIAGMVLLTAGIWWYENKYGPEGPFRSEHHH
jgi:hypothetical protein